MRLNSTHLGETPHTFVETFVVASWEEHLRQHRDRLTSADRDFDAQARGLSNPSSQTRQGNDLWVVVHHPRRGGHFGVIVGEA